MKIVKTVAVLALAMALIPAVAAKQETFEWSGSVGSGDTVEIKGVNGGIEASPSTSGQLEVTAVKKGRRDDPSEVRIEVVEHGDGVTICAVYPGDRNECAPGDGGRLGANDNDVSVSFTVRVPSGAHFVGKTVNGGVEADGIDGNVEATTVNGGIKASASGWVSAETVNGGIKVSMGRTDWNGSLELTTVNGGITVDLPHGASTDVDLATANGSIESDFPIQMRGKWTNKRADGSIGGGGRELEMESVNGSITLRERG